MTSGKTRSETLTALQLAFRAQSSGTVLLHSAVANRLGIGITDLSCLNILTMYGPQTAGQLADRIGITRGGAVTTMIDRLEAAGFVRRDRDPADRRRVLVLVRDKALQKVAPLFGGLWEMLGEQFATRTDAELALLADIVTESVTALDRAREGLRGKP
ncbi:MarR family winged helix-turn-helix transcriptional regulator [Nocardia sp. NPDC001965]